MADQFQQTHDKNPIMGDGYTFRSWRFSFRELILGLLLGVLLLTCLFLAGFLGKSSSDLQQAQTGALAAQNACKGSTCLHTSAHIMELLNVSADPCDDFYNFACGGYTVKNPVDEYTLYQSIWKQMYQENQDQLMAILNSPSKRYMDWSAERKVKDFFVSCTDDFRLEQLKAKPMLDKVFPLLGGWYVKDASWNAGSWNFNTVLKKVNTDLWPGGEQPEFHTEISAFASNAEYQGDAYKEANRLTLNDLNQRDAGGQIDYIAQMAYMFNEASITGNTQVVVPYPTYLTNLTAMIKAMDASSRNRKLHNYITWRVLESYIQDLSSDYVHANRQFYMDKYGRANFQGRTGYCFGRTKHVLPLSLSALYIQARFDSCNKDKI